MPMRSRFPGFATVRVACSLCGWFRVLGHTGSNGTVRAFIRLAPDPTSCNVVWSRVIEVPAKSEAEAWTARLCGYRDLAEEWHWRRSHAQLAGTLRDSKWLVQGRPCPRCKRLGGARLDVWFDPEPGHTSGVLVMCEADASSE
jgi:hypothetical protein